MSGEAPLGLDKLADQVERAIGEKRVDVAVLALLCYDFFLTLPSEIRYIWQPSWSRNCQTRPRTVTLIPQILFTLARYPAILNAIVQIFYSSGSRNHPQDCISLLQTGTSLTALLFFITEVILLLRALANHRHNKLIYWGLVTLFLLSVGASIVAIVIWSQTLFPIPPPVSFLPGCYFKKGSSILQVDYVVIGAWEFVIFFLALCKCWKIYTSQPHGVGTRLGLPCVLWRDGFHFYLLIWLTSISSFTSFLLVASHLTSVLLAFQRTFHSICAGRLLLHVRSLADDPTSCPFNIVPDAEPAEDPERRIGVGMGVGTGNGGAYALELTGMAAAGGGEGGRRLSTVVEDLSEESECL